MREIRTRLLYIVCTIAVVALGLASRRYAKNLPVFVAEYAGDTLWALMVFLGASAVAPEARLAHRAGFALAFAYAIEVSQLYHAPWIDAVRRTALGGLVLGFGFLWSDFVCYTIGVLIGALADYLVHRGPNDTLGPAAEL